MALPWRLVTLLLVTWIRGSCVFCLVGRRENRTPMTANGIESLQRRALHALWKDAGGDRWANADKWTSSDRVCTWYGTTCTNGGSKITEIDLSFNRLEGSIARLFWTLPFLQKVNLRGNHLTHHGFNGLTMENASTAPLEWVDLTENSLVDIRGVSGMPDSLSELHLTSNRLKGRIHPELFELTKLKKLYLSFNAMTGSLPTAIQNMRNLRELHLYGNKFTGTIPTQLGKLNRLQVLSLAENDLEGTLPNEIGQMINLHTLSLHNAEPESGSFNGTLPNWKNLVFLKELYLNGNSLSGTIPNQFLQHANSSEMVIQLSNNRLTGTVPANLGRFTSLQLDVIDNQIQEIDPSLCAKKQWMNGLVERYGCSAILCPRGFSNALGRQTGSDDSQTCQKCPDSDGTAAAAAAAASSLLFMGSTSCVPDHYLFQPKLEDWQVLIRLYMELSGPVSWYNTTGWNIIDSLYDKKDLAQLTQTDVGNICQWHGVTCVRFGTMVIELDLSDNGLVGTLPLDFFDLVGLRRLDLSKNLISIDQDKGLTGLIRLPSLDYLDVSETDTRNLNGIGGAKKLKSLFMNGIHWPVNGAPNEFYSLSNLEHLEIQHSRIAGKLSNQIGNFVKLKHVDVSNNELSGSIPSVLWASSTLVSIDLSHNDFSGSLPTQYPAMSNLHTLRIDHTEKSGDGITGKLPSFNGMTKLRELSLSSNSINGVIPTNFLSGITDKSEPLKINLSFNNLSGSIPLDLKEFKAIDLNVVQNEISGIPDVLCSKNNWMNGEVGLVKSCDAIMCQPKFWSLSGRASHKIPCRDCPDRQFWGSTFCPTESDYPEQYDERRILAKVYASMDWETTANWFVSGIEMCEFEGVTCDGSDGNASGIIALDFTSFGLSGTMGSDVFDLKKLNELMLNSVDIKLDKIGHATKLHTLHISNANIKSLNGIGNAPPSLKTLHVSRNDFLTGTIPEELFMLDNLEKLHLFKNRLSGTLSTSITNMQSLTEIWLNDNDLTGRVSKALGNITSLEKLALGHNLFSGFIPTELGHLSKLALLSLEGQRSKDKLLGPLYDFASNSNLLSLDLSDNALTGDIPDSLLNGTNRLGAVWVNLSSNRLEGSIPGNLDEFTNLYIDLADNKITNILGSRFCNQQHGEWMDGRVAQLSFSCDAILCPPGTSLPSGFQLEQNKPCLPCNDPIEAQYFGTTECVLPAKVVEKLILEFLYENLNGHQWTRQDNWMSDEPICRWYGVTCTNHTSGAADHGVVSVSLQRNNLASSASPSTISNLFFSLPSLESLNIEGNDVPLSFEQIGNLTKLQSLIVSQTGLLSLDGIGKAKALRELHANNNALAGPLSQELFSLTKLELLYLSFNKLSGSLPLEIQKLTKLREFYISGNDIEGSIPTQIGKLTELRALAMSANELFGSLPNEVQLPKLEYVTLFGQKGERRIDGSLLTFEESPNLWFLDLSSNDINGSISENFLKNNVNAENKAVSIYLNFNEIRGSVPIALGRFSNLDLGLAGNMIDYISPSLCDKDHRLWMNGAVGIVGNCDVILCRKGTYGTLGRQRDSSTPCLTCDNSEGAMFLGSTYCLEPDGERRILEKLYAETGGSNWRVSTGWMKEKIPICQWYGVTCFSAADDIGVLALELDDNGLVGTAPSELYTLPHLKSISLKENIELVVGFDGIENAISLEELYLSATDIQSFNGIEFAPRLKELHLTNIGLTGTLPDEFFYLSSLEELYLNYNSFSGTLSPKIGQLKNLKYFYVYDNELSGSIPSEIASLSTLEDLVLAENIFSGQIPVELSSMPNLRLFSCFRREKAGPKLEGTLPAFDMVPKLTNLWIGHNLIHGTIPAEFLSSSHDIEVVSLDHNRLVGAVPFELNRYESMPFTIELAGNRISELPREMCDNALWMNGTVRENRCDAIMCDVNSASPLGRHVDDNSECQQCESKDAALFFGSTTCDIQAEERDILLKLYDSCGGVDWEVKDGWDTSETICKWYGITCTKFNTVHSIRLGGNNIRNTPPKELFDLPDLHVLWLHSNPITFRFVNIESATSLSDLRLDATGMTSVDGISRAQSLVDLNLRFNLIGGSFPSEILKMTNLKTLSLGDNNLTGTFPDDAFASLSRLRVLRLGSNQLSGMLPSFRECKSINVVDLSGNRMSGPIPDTFFDRTSVNANLFIDVSDNQLSGFVPLELDRFVSLTLYLRENRITGIAKELCNNVGWNDGDLEKFGCSGLLCPPGTWNNFGRETQNENTCIPCQSSQNSIYYGQNSCGDVTLFSPTSAATVDKLQVGGLWMIILSPILLLWI